MFAKCAHVCGFFYLRGQYGTVRNRRQQALLCFAYGFPYTLVFGKRVPSTEGYVFPRRFEM